MKKQILLETHEDELDKILDFLNFFAANIDKDSRDYILDGLLTVKSANTKATFNKVLANPDCFEALGLLAICSIINICPECLLIGLSNVDDRSKKDSQHLKTCMG